jgi:hypothetical protein
LIGGIRRDGLLLGSRGITELLECQLCYFLGVGHLFLKFLQPAPIKLHKFYIGTCQVKQEMDGEVWKCAIPFVQHLVSFFNAEIGY